MLNMSMEPTYSERESELYKGVCSVVNNIYGRRELFAERAFDDYSKIFGLFAYYIAGWANSGDSDIASSVCSRYVKEIETKFNIRVAKLSGRKLNSMYRNIRRITENEMKSSISTDKIIDVQVEQVSFKKTSGNSRFFKCRDESVLFVIVPKYKLQKVA